MKEPILYFQVDSSTTAYENILEEVLDLKKKYGLLSCPIIEKTKKETNLERRYPMPPESKINMKEISCDSCRKTVYRQMWFIYKNQFDVIRNSLIKLCVENILSLSEYDIDVDADGFCLESIELGGVKVDGSLYSFDLSFFSKYIGRVHTTIIASVTPFGVETYSMQNINFEELRGC